MATVTELGESWTTSGDHTVTATPAVGDLIVVVHGGSGWVGGDTDVITDDNPGGGGSYTQIGGNPFSTGGGTAGALWISIRNSRITSASSTIFTEDMTGLTGSGLTVLAVSGMTRAGQLAVRQSIGESTQTESPVVITFGAVTLTANPVILGCFGEDNPAALGPPASYTETTDTGWATPDSGIHVCYVSSGQTSSAYTYASGAFTDHNEVGVELNTADITEAPSWNSFTESAGMIGRRYV